MTDDRAVIAHGDWSARNVRFGGGELLCAYDWESLQRCPESTAVGIAAATWRALGVAGDPLAPAAPEIERYVQQYQLARGRPFTTTQRRSALAAAVYTLAYTARCEHALTPGIRTGAVRASRRRRRTPIAPRLAMTATAPGGVISPWPGPRIWCPAVRRPPYPRRYRNSGPAPSGRSVERRRRRWGGESCALFRRTSAVLGLVVAITAGLVASAPDSSLPPSTDLHHVTTWQSNHRVRRHPSRHRRLGGLRLVRIRRGAWAGCNNTVRRGVPGEPSFTQ